MCQRINILKILCTLSTLALANPTFAELRQLNDDTLETINAQAGISLAVSDLSVYHHLDRLYYAGTDGGYLSLENITVHDGGNAPAKIDIGVADADGDGLIEPLTLDAFTVSDAASPIDGQSLVRLAAPDWLQEKAYHIESVRIAGYETGLAYDLGSLDIGPVHLPGFELYVGGHSDGIDFQLGAGLQIDQLRLTTNTAGDALEATGIRFAESFSGAPEDPASWAGQGNFTVGDLFSGAPATFDVGGVTLDDGSQAAVVALALPMTGSLRMENINLNGSDFGPVAIDGIQVHALEVVFVP
jgi:hypothetical protein